MRMQSKPGESPSARGDLKQNMAVAVDSGVIALEILFRYFHHGDSLFINKASKENDYALSFNSCNLVRRGFLPAPYGEEGQKERPWERTCNDCWDYHHSRPQRPRSFWSAPRIATTCQAQRHSGFEWLCVNTID